ncbi:MAG: ATP-binding protein [Firmicutes bacterium]|nr:ATP-binding protein [Bacillota bacterium]
MIKKVKWKEHPILGNLELDFSKNDGTIYNTIILAGENGTGKTTIIENLSTFLNLGALDSIEYIDYIINGVEYSIFPQDDNNGIKYGFHQRQNKNDGKIVKIFNGTNSSKQKIEEDLEDIRHYGCAYSKARSGFETKKVISTTTQQLDVEKYEDDDANDFTFIKQLIIDVETQDNSEWMEVTRKRTGKSFEEFKKESKLYRFEKAFNDFFDNVTFERVDNTDSVEKKIIFEKHGKKINIDSLSTGEKQIVFRGAHLLKNVNNISNGIVLIDEPELSMHPKWQSKILQFYRNLFTKDGNQKTQILVATHSEYVLKSALEDRDNVLVITLHDDNGVIKVNNITAPIILPTITSAEINYLAFGIISPDLHIELYGYLQSKTNQNYLDGCDAYIYGHHKFDSVKHEKISKFRKHTYKTLPTFIRNSIDHPSTTMPYTNDELKTSIELLIELCK